MLGECRPRLDLTEMKTVVTSVYVLASESQALVAKSVAHRT